MTKKNLARKTSGIRMRAVAEPQSGIQERPNGVPPETVCEALEIDLIQSPRIAALRLFEIATTEDTIIIAWHPDMRIRRGRIWEGIARVILTRINGDFSVETARELAIRMANSEVIHG